MAAERLRMVPLLPRKRWVLAPFMNMLIGWENTVHVWRVLRSTYGLLLLQGNQVMNMSHNFLLRCSTCLHAAPKCMHTSGTWPETSGKYSHTWYACRFIRGTHDWALTVTPSTGPRSRSHNVFDREELDPQRISSVGEVQVADDASTSNVRVSSSDSLN